MTKQEKLTMAKQLQEEYEAELAAMEQLSVEHDERVEAIITDYSDMGEPALRIKKKKS